MPPTKRGPFAERIHTIFKTKGWKDNHLAPAVSGSLIQKTRNQNYQPTERMVGMIAEALKANKVSVEARELWGLLDEQKRGSMQYRTISQNLESGLSKGPKVTETATKQRHLIRRNAGLTEDKTGDHAPVEKEIREFLQAQKLVRGFDGHVIELFPSPELRGWGRKQVTHSYAGDYHPPPSFEKLIERFPAPPPIREYFGLRQCSALPIADENESVAFELVGGTWQHLFALNKIFLHRHNDSACRMFRNEFEGSWIQYPENAPLKGTPLYHQVVAEILVLTSDNKLVLGKRNDTLWLGGLWSASLEEQVLRGDPHHPGRKDSHLFDAADRGAEEELGVTIRHEETKLLSVAIAWSNFSGVFFFVVRCEEDFEGVVNAWTHVRHDPNEAVALDCIDATPISIQAALASNQHNPTPNWRRRIVVQNPIAGWHLTAKARLRALLGHLHYLESNT